MSPILHRTPLALAILFAFDPGRNLTAGLRPIF